VKPALIIQCGESKRDGVHLVRDLYTGPLWSTYRARCRDAGIEGVHPTLDVFVLSGQFGLRRETDALPWYQHRLVLGEVPALSATVRDQVHRFYPDLASRSVHFVGSALYRSVLTGAGLSVRDVAPAGADLLGMRKALSAFLRQCAPRPVLDLDSILARVKRAR